MIMMITHCFGWPQHLPSILDLYIASSQDDPQPRANMRHTQKRRKSRKRQSEGREGKESMMQMERKETNSFIGISGRSIMTCQPCSEDFLCLFFLMSACIALALNTYTNTSTHTNTHNLNSRPETKPTEWMPESFDERLISDEPRVGILSEKVLLWPLVWPSGTWFQRSLRAGSLVSSLSRTQAPASQHCHQDGAMLQLTAVTGRSLRKYNNIPSCLQSHFYLG